MTLLTRQEVAKHLRVSKDKVADIPFKELPFIKYGHRTIRYKDTDVFDFIRKAADRTRRQELRR